MSAERGKPVSDDALVAFVKKRKHGVTPEQIAEHFGIVRSTAMRRMCKLETAKRIEVVVTLTERDYLSNGSGRNLTYFPAETSR